MNLRDPSLLEAQNPVTLVSGLQGLEELGEHPGPIPGLDSYQSVLEQLCYQTCETPFLPLMDPRTF